MESSLSQVSDTDIAVNQEKWAREQELLKKRLTLKDDFLWQIPPFLPNSEENVGKSRLRYIGGVDLSYSKDDSSIACGALVVMDLNTLSVVYEDFDVVRLAMPYIPGFLAFRECHVLLGLLKKMNLNAHPFYPQGVIFLSCDTSTRVTIEYSSKAIICTGLPFLLDWFMDIWACFQIRLLMVDGNGILHPRGIADGFGHLFGTTSQPHKFYWNTAKTNLRYFKGFGLASHLAVLCDLPTIGVGKNLHHIDGLTHMEVKRLLPKNTKCGGDVMNLVGKSGHIWGAALRCNESCSKPIFISIGHCISLETAITIVRLCCRFRVPEPIRQADIRSREYLQKKLSSIEKS